MAVCVGLARAEMRSAQWLRSSGRREREEGRRDAMQLGLWRCIDSSLQICDMPEGARWPVGHC